jgi:HK97 family phage major capsid protein
MTFGPPTQDQLDRMIQRRTDVKACAESLLIERRAAGIEELDQVDSIRFRAMQADLQQLDDSITEYRVDLQRSQLPPQYASLGGSSGGRHVGTAGRLAPLGFADDEMRKLQAAAQRGETCRIESRAFSTAESLLPAGLFPTPVEGLHEGRVLDALPGFAMETGKLTFIRHVSTTGSAVVVGEGQVKPELVFETDEVTEAARKIAAHNGLSYEIIADWPAFQSYCGAELYRQVIDTENDQLLNGDGTGLSMTGFFSTSGILTEDATVTAPDTALDVIERAIAALRVGPALAVANLAVFHPSTWSAIRRTKDAQDRYLTQPDPTIGEAASVWGVPVISTTACPAGKGLLVDTAKFGYVAVREGLSMRIGFSGDDLTRNILRTVAEERLVLCVTRASAVLAITGLPTATVAGAKAKASK